MSDYPTRKAVSTDMRGTEAKALSAHIQSNLQRLGPQCQVHPVKTPLLDLRSALALVVGLGIVCLIVKRQIRGSSVLSHLVCAFRVIRAAHRLPPRADRSAPRR